MSDLSNRLPGRMLLVWVAQSLPTPARCHACGGQEPALRQRVLLHPPAVAGDQPFAERIDALYEAWLAEQLSGQLRVSEPELVGGDCLARFVAQFQAQPETEADLIQWLREGRIPDVIVGAMSVEPGQSGLTFPMTLGLFGAWSLHDIVQLVNAPPGSL